MAFLLGGWFKTDEDDINDLPVDLRDIYLNPWKVFSGIFILTGDSDHLFRTAHTFIIGTY